MEKQRRFLLLPLFFSALLLAGCGRKFPVLLDQAENSFSKKDYISTIDTLNLAMPRWKESHGVENKARAYELMGKSYHQLRNTDKAIESYREAVNLSKNTYDSASALGILYLAKSQPYQAAEAFEKALKMKHDDPQALLGLGNSYFAQKRYEDAKIYYNKVLDVSPGVREAMDCLQAMRGMKRPTVKKTVKKAPAPAPAKKKATPASTKKKR